MSKLLDQSVKARKGGTYDFICPVNDGSCGDPNEGTPFQSTGWPTKATATARGAEHFREHKTGADPDTDTVPMSSLEDFRAKHNLSVDAKGVVTAKDL